jgi:EAL domain-containing protein (putative c-di-GMP-specific phosphodiesterase class I)
MFQELIEEHRLSSQLPRALKEEQMKLYLQPQVNRLGQVIGAEALMRWEHPERGLLMPGDFLPYFEKNYMIVSTDQYMWEKACMLLRKWKDEGRTDWYVAVNISPSDFEYVDVCEELGELVKKYEIDPAKLRVEITETTIMQNPRRQIKLIGRLRLAGFYVEMDDFGSGYSSFAMLKDIHVDALKLDMNFLSRNGNDDRGKKILKAMADLVEELKMTMVAEGVENLDQVEYLRQIGCDVYQGYYFGKPVTVEEFEKVFSVNDEKRVGA